MRIPLAAVAAALALAAVSSAPAWAQSADVAAVGKVGDSYAAAWAKGDAKALAAHFDTDGVHIHASGVVQRSRAAIEKYYAESFAGPLKGSRITIVTGPVRMLKPDVAVADGSYAVSGVRGPDGKEVPIKGLYGNVLVKKGGQWLLSAVTALEPPPGPPPQ
jgi:uncharacterized protein (TIGR02246 family)